MPIFLVATRDPNPDLEAELKNRFPGDVLGIADNQWIVSNREMTNKFTNELDPGKGGKWGDLIVARIGSVNGWQDTDTWDWIDEKRLEHVYSHG